mmetsp:Transcript_20312/g.31094  ORF Transcript_20312/g.31094 Transcript_20312/m.31094 type:complete len:81 (-) Transcript_20312:358-600(-)
MARAEESGGNIVSLSEATTTTLPSLSEIHWFKSNTALLRCALTPSATLSSMAFQIPSSGIWRLNSAAIGDASIFAICIFA